VPLCVNSDAHSVQGLQMMEYGVATARRGWAEAHHVINTLCLEDLMTWLQRKEHRAANRATADLAQ